MTLNTVDQQILSTVQTSGLQRANSTDDILTAIFLQLNSDPDAIMNLAGLAVSRMRDDCALIRDDLQYITDNLAVVHTRVVGSPAAVTKNIKNSLEGALSANAFRRGALLTAALASARRQLSAVTSATGLAGEDLIIDLLLRAERITSVHRSLIERRGFLLTFLTKYMAGGLSRRAADSTINTALEAINSLEFDHSVSSSTSVTVATHLGLVSEARTLRSPLSEKYRGTVSVPDGIPAALTATVSVPCNNAAQESITLNVDGTSCSFILAAARPAEIIVSPLDVYNLAGEATSRYPLATGSGISILVDNIIVTLVTVAPLADAAALISYLDTELDPYGVAVTSYSTSSMRVYSDGTAGSIKRISFLDNAVSGT